MARSKKSLAEIKRERWRLRAFLSQCESKIRYQTKELAQKFADLDGRRYGDKMRVYPCAFCAGFHLARIRNASV